MISLAMTIDLEWCPPVVVNWMLERFAEAGVRATLFATDTPRMDLGGNEIALHPDPYRPGSEGMVSEARRLKEIYPRAVGIRMHRLAWDTGIEAPIAELGLGYVSTYMVPGQLVRPFRVSPHLVHFPIYYMDHQEIWHDSQFEQPFSLRSLDLRTPGLYVFDFHPNLLFTNACSESFYREQVHPAYQDPDALLKLRHTGRGCFDLFRDLLGLRHRADVQFVTLAEVYEKVVNGVSPFDVGPTRTCLSRRVDCRTPEAEKSAMGSYEHRGGLREEAKVLGQSSATRL